MNLEDPTTYGDAVERGALFLAHHYPNFLDVIDLSGLDMDSFDRCVACQASGLDFFGFLARHQLTWEMAMHLGFVVDDDLLHDDEDDFEEIASILYRREAALEQAWRRHVVRYRLQGPVWSTTIASCA